MAVRNVSVNKETKEQAELFVLYIFNMRNRAFKTYQNMLNFVFHDFCPHGYQDSELLSNSFKIY